MNICSESKMSALQKILQDFRNTILDDKLSADEGYITPKIVFESAGIK